MRDLTNGKLEITRIFAKSIGTDSLERAIKSLENIEKNHFLETTITNDFAAHSFYFERHEIASNKFRGNGGIIFSDISKGIGSGNAPSFSISIDNNTTRHWSIRS